MLRFRMSSHHCAVFCIVFILAFFACSGGGSDDSAISQSGWGTAEPVPGSLPIDIIDHDMDIDSAGNAMVVWSQDGGVYSNRYLSSTGWADAQRINAAGSGYLIHVDAGPGGSAVVVWYHSDGIFANHFDAESGWQTAEMISSNDRVEKLDVALDQGGQAFAIWSRSTGSHTVYYRYSLFDPGSGWQQDMELTTGHSTEIAGFEAFFEMDGRPAVLINGVGHGVTIWDYDPDTGWTSEFFPGCDYPCDYYEVDGTVSVAAGEASINAVWAWWMTDDTTSSYRSDIYFRRSETETGWGEVERIDATDDYVREPCMAADADGNAIVVWQQGAPDAYSIYARRYDVNTGWGSEQRIGSDDTASDSNARIAVNPAGRAVVVWEHTQGSSTRIYSNRYDPEAGWNEPTCIDSQEAGDDSSNPRVVIDPAGKALAVWRQNNGTVTRLYTNRFE
jgi:hypothetical protein